MRAGGMRRATYPLVFVLVTMAASPMTAMAQDSSDSPPSASPVSAPEPSADQVISGVFDVGGHGLYLDCQGTGSPTIVYLHGAIWDTAEVPLPHANGQFAQRALDDEYRVCVYDRRNIGMSEVVDAPQSPEDAIADMHGLLATAGVEPPYVLLGASFGGLLAYLYANEYPDEVVGMLLLDSMFPDELALDALFPPEERQEAFVDEDENGSPERMSHFRVLSAAQPYIGHEPAIPVTYLSSIPEGYDVGDDLPQAYRDQILGLQQTYVERFSPGTYLRVDSPHFMEAAIPDRVVEELRTVIEEAGFQGG
jgi:pimeloyl-ACP methyl ester carboxylesterase